MSVEKKKKTKGLPDFVDKHVGKQLKNRRSLLGISQEKLADAVGVTFQQVQKYERSANRISASRLYNFSKVLEVSIDYFYDGLDLSGKKSTAASGMSDNAQEDFGSAPVKSDTLPEDVMNKKETLDLVRTYYSVNDQKKRKEMLKFLKTMAKNIS